MLCGEDSDKMTFTSFLDSGTTDLLTTDELKICMPRLQAAVGSSQIREKIAGLLIPTLKYVQKTNNITQTVCHYI